MQLRLQQGLAVSVHHELVIASSTSILYWLVTQVRALKAETETTPRSATSKNLPRKSPTGGESSQNKHTIEEISFSTPLSPKMWPRKLGSLYICIYTCIYKIYILPLSLDNNVQCIVEKQTSKTS